MGFLSGDWSERVCILLQCLDIPRIHCRGTSPLYPVYLLDLWGVGSNPVALGRALTFSLIQSWPREPPQLKHFSNEHCGLFWAVGWAWTKYKDYSMGWMRLYWLVNHTISLPSLYRQIDHKYSSAIIRPPKLNLLFIISSHIFCYWTTSGRLHGRLKIRSGRCGWQRDLLGWSREPKWVP
jgi:hypothetical protein